MVVIQRDKLFRETLSNRLGIKEYRFGYLKFYEGER